MSHQPISIEQLRDLINKGEVNDPLVFLESIMNGQDPRKLSRIYELVCEIDDFKQDQVSNEDWNELYDLVFNNYKYYTVSLADSIGASKTLAEYLHAKRKQVEVRGAEGSSGDPANNPLTEEEIILFRERFNDEF